MAYMLVVVVRDTEKGQAILERWRASGVKGVTIIASAGLGHRPEDGPRDDMPLFPSLRTLFAVEEVVHRTFFSIIDSDETLKRAIADAEAVVGDFDAPDTGIMFVAPVTQAWGLRHE